MINNYDIRVAIASLLYKIIIADGQESQLEINKFHQIFKNNFGISYEDSLQLFEKVSSETTTLDEVITKIKDDLINSPIIKIDIMKYLNEMILSDGISEEEYKVFEEIQNKLI
jgi:uncharacterized tellurite resistance protein B-like protein